MHTKMHIVPCGVSFSMGKKSNYNIDIQKWITGAQVGKGYQLYT